MLKSRYLAYCLALGGSLLSLLCPTETMSSDRHVAKPIVHMIAGYAVEPSNMTIPIPKSVPEHDHYYHATAFNGNDRCTITQLFLRGFNVKVWATDYQKQKDLLGKGWHYTKGKTTKTESGSAQDLLPDASAGTFIQQFRQRNPHNVPCTITGSSTTCAIVYPSIIEVITWPKDSKTKETKRIINVSIEKTEASEKLPQIAVNNEDSVEIYSFDEPLKSLTKAIDQALNPMRFSRKQKSKSLKIA
jgi:hypothetical protein